MPEYTAEAGHIRIHGIPEREVGTDDLRQTIRGTLSGHVTVLFFQKRILDRKVFDSELTHCEDMDFLVSVLYGESYLIKMNNFSAYNHYYNPQSAVHDRRRLFDEQGRLQFVKAYRRIQKKVEDNSNLYDLIRYRIASSSINYYFQATDDMQRKLMYRDIRKEFHGFFRHFRCTSDFKLLFALPVIILCQKRFLNPETVRNLILRDHQKRI